MLRRAALAGLAIALAGAAPARADLAQLKAACKPMAAEDAPAYTYRFCDDGVPDHGGRTANPGADRAVAVPAAYAGIDGLPPADPATAAAVPGNDGGTVAIDIDVTLPDPARVPRPASGYPLLVLMHGCCGGSRRSWESTKMADGGEKWHYSNVWFAARGYVVLTYTARGFVDGNGYGSTGETQLDSLAYEINDFQHLAGQLADDPFFDVDPSRIVATGGSYGGGFTWLALTDPVWTSPAGKPMRLAAVATKYGWTDLIGSLLPTGRHFYENDAAHALPATDGSDSGYMPGQKIGMPIRSILVGLYGSGETGVPPGSPHTTFPAQIREAITCTETLYPAEANPLCDGPRATFVPQTLVERSAYYRNGFFERVRTDPAYRVPVFSAGTFTDPLFPPVEHRRMAERLRNSFPGYPIQEAYGDYQHFTQNKAKEWGDVCGADRHVCAPADHPGGDLDAAPASRVLAGITTKLNAFLDHHVRRIGKAPARDVQANLQVCPQNAGEGQPADEPGPSFTAPSFDALTPGELRLDFAGEQTTTSTSGDPDHALAADPVANQVGNGNRCPVHTDRAGAGVATYESAPLARDATMIGGGLLTVGYRASGDLESLQLNARLYDVLPDGTTAVMVDRGPRRIDPARDGTEKVTFQLHGNGWRFPAGHRVRLELMQDDDPYLKRSDSASSMTITGAQLVLPVRETWGGVDPTGAGIPGGKPRDSARPAVRLYAAGWASTLGRGPRFRVRISGSDVGTGLRGYRAQVRRVGSSRWSRLGVRRSAVTVRGRGGRGYVIRVRAVDRAGNSGRWVSARVTVPRDDRAVRLRGPWRRARARSAWRGTLASCARASCSARVRFRGREVALIGPRPARDIRVVVRLDGRRRVLRIRAGSPVGPRRVLALVRAKRRGAHTLVLRPGDGRLVLDAVGTR
jgi:dienelactone hydrolase